MDFWPHSFVALCLIGVFFVFRWLLFKFDQFMYPVEFCDVFDVLKGEMNFRQIRKQLAENQKRSIGYWELKKHLDALQNNESVEKLTRIVGRRKIAMYRRVQEPGITIPQRPQRQLMRIVA